MKVTLLKDWAGYSKSEVVEIEDKDVLKKGFEIKLFKADPADLDALEEGPTGTPETKK